MKKLLAIVVLGLLWSGNVFSEPIKVKDLQCSTLKNNFRDKYKNDYWSITKNDSFAEMTFLSDKGFEVVVWEFDVRKNLDFIWFERIGGIKDSIEYVLSRNDGTMILKYFGSETKLKCKPFNEKSNIFDLLKSKAEENLKKKKSGIKF